MEKKLMFSTELISIKKNPNLVNICYFMGYCAIGKKQFYNNCEK